jgi:[ribosomal protein S18]-alanine N-acetyltransferase
MESKSIQIVIKEAKNEDVYELRKCNKACLPVYYPYGAYTNFIESNKSIVLIAKCDNNVIGYVIGEINMEYPDRFHIISFGVCSKFRKNKIGTVLMNKIIEMVQKKYFSTTKISLYVMASNDVAINFYKSIGFKADKLMKNYYQSFNEDGYLFIKKLT